MPVLSSKLAHWTLSLVAAASALTDDQTLTSTATSEGEDAPKEIETDAPAGETYSSDSEPLAGGDSTHESSSDEEE